MNRLFINLYLVVTLVFSLIYKLIRSLTNYKMVAGIPTPNPRLTIIEPLDMSKIESAWTKWKQTFQIYIAAEFAVDPPDRRKLALFLHLIGPAGLKKANKSFPQLRNFDSPEAKKVSFEEVWNKFNYHSLTRKQKYSKGLFGCMRKTCNFCW